MPTQRTGQQDTVQPTFPFNKLPPELRFLIWNQALVQESSERLVLLDLHPPSIYPFKSLVSRILAVNAESRRCALNFYETSLSVYRLKRKGVEWEDVFTKNIYLEIITRPTNSRGKLYLSSKHDLFMSGLTVYIHEQKPMVTWDLLGKPDTMGQVWEDRPIAVFPCPIEDKDSYLPDLKYVTDSASNLLGSIENVLELRKYHSHARFHKVPSCNLLCSEYYDDFVRPRAWPTDPFRDIKQYWYLPWLVILSDGTPSCKLPPYYFSVEELLEPVLIELSEQVPGGKLWDGCQQKRELTWVDRVEPNEDQRVKRRRYLVDRLANDPWACNCEEGLQCIIRDGKSGKRVARARVRE
ncbi:hypothetical protein F5Y04DRAFT_281665 [Hypomontagnella monticulosa]|nr:hypothetical protein F5Y04DRAFT_281665 [Hypomontagnella monticulosa]